MNTDAITEAKTRLGVAIAIRMLRNPSLIGNHAGAILANMLEAIVPAPNYAGGSDTIAMVDARARQISEVTATFTGNDEKDAAAVRDAVSAWKASAMFSVQTALGLGDDRN